MTYNRKESKKNRDKAPPLFFSFRENNLARGAGRGLQNKGRQNKQPPISVHSERRLVDQGDLGPTLGIGEFS